MPIYEPQQGPVDLLSWARLFEDTRLKEENLRMESRKAGMEYAQGMQDIAAGSLKLKLAETLLPITVKNAQLESQKLGIEIDQLKTEHDVFELQHNATTLKWADLNARQQAMREVEQRRLEMTAEQWGLPDLFSEAFHVMATGTPDQIMAMDVAIQNAPGDVKKSQIYRSGLEKWTTLFSNQRLITMAQSLDAKEKRLLESGAPTADAEKLFPAVAAIVDVPSEKPGAVTGAFLPHAQQEAIKRISAIEQLPTANQRYRAFGAFLPVAYALDDLLPKEERQGDKSISRLVLQRVGLGEWDPRTQWQGSVRKTLLPTSEEAAAEKQRPRATTTLGAGSVSGKQELWARINFSAGRQAAIEGAQSELGAGDVIAAHLERAEKRMAAGDKEGAELDLAFALAKIGGEEPRFGPSALTPRLRELKQVRDAKERLVEKAYQTGSALGTFSALPRTEPQPRVSYTGRVGPQPQRAARITEPAVRDLAAAIKARQVAKGGAVDADEVIRQYVRDHPDEARKIAEGL